MSIDSRELSKWRALWAIDPWGNDREDLRSGTISAAAANAGRLTAMAQGAKLSGDWYKPRDFMPYSDPEKPDVNRLRGKLMALVDTQRAWHGDGEASSAGDQRRQQAG